MKREKSASKLRADVPVVLREPSGELHKSKLNVASSGYGITRQKSDTIRPRTAKHDSPTHEHDFTRQTSDIGTSSSTHLKGLDFSNVKSSGYGSASPATKRRGPSDGSRRSTEGFGSTEQLSRQKSGDLLSRQKSGDLLSRQKSGDLLSRQKSGDLLGRPSSMRKSVSREDVKPRSSPREDRKSHSSSKEKLQSRTSSEEEALGSPKKSPSPPLRSTSMKNIREDKTDGAKATKTSTPSSPTKTMSGSRRSVETAGPKPRKGTSTTPRSSKKK